MTDNEPRLNPEVEAEIRSYGNKANGQPTPHPSPHPQGGREVLTAAQRFRLIEIAHESTDLDVKNLAIDLLHRTG